MFSEAAEERYGSAYMDWIKENAMPLSAAGTLGMLAVWTFYLALFYHQYAEHRRPKLMVHITNSLLERAECLIINMGQEPLHIEAVIGVLKQQDSEVTVLVTDFHGTDPHTPPAVCEAILKQGPLRSTDFISIGPVTELLQRMRYANVPGSGGLVLEVRVVAFGNGHKPVGAQRRFEIQPQDGVSTIYPDSVYTEQFSSRRKRDYALDWLEKAAQANVAHARQAQALDQA